MKAKLVTRNTASRFLALALIAILPGCGGSGTLALPPPASAAEFVLAVNLATGASNLSVEKIDPTTGALTPVAGSPFGGVTSPSSVAVEPSTKFAYVTNFSDNTISAYGINSTTGALTPIAGSPFAAAGNPVMIATEASGKYVYTANQSSADVSGFAINSSTGTLAALPGSPYSSGPAPVAIVVDHVGRFVYVANSAAPSISVFSISPGTGDLTPVPGSPFAADFFPRGFAIDPHDKFLYVGIASSFMGDSTEVMAFSIGSSGTLTPVAGSPFTAARNPVSLAVDSSGKFLYVGNSQDNSLSAFSINSSGALSPIGGSPYPLSGFPLSAVTDASGKFLYLGGAGIFGFSIDAASGALIQVPGSPVPAGSNIFSLTTVEPK